GRITAQNQTPSGTQGGQIHVTGEQVRIASTAQLDASAPAGGGEVLIGGGWQGNDSRLSNALNTLVEAGAKLSANATQRGNGGTIVLWSDGLTQAHGTLSARGGPEGGNGGQVETSGSTLQRSGLPDVSAPQGQAGLWLLDPDYIEIAGGAAPSPSPNPPGPPPMMALQVVGGMGTTTLYESELESFDGQIELRANHAIVATTLSSLFDEGLVVRGGLTLSTVNAPGPIPVAPLSFGGFTTGIDLTATNFLGVHNEGSTQANLLIHAGTDAMPVPGVVLKVPDIQVSSNSFTLGPGNITLRSSGDLLARQISTYNNTFTFASGGDVLLDAPKGLLVVGDVGTSVNGFVGGPKAGDITINGNVVRLRGFLNADGRADVSFGSAPGNINVTSGLACANPCDMPTLILDPDPLLANSTSIFVSARGGANILNAQNPIPEGGGSISLVAQKGSIEAAGPLVQLVINADGVTLDGTPFAQSGSNGGQVTVSADRHISVPGLFIDAAGGLGQDESGGLRAGAGGAGGSVTVQAQTGILVSSLSVNVNGGAGGNATEDSETAGSGRTAGQGGAAGFVTVSTAAGGLINPNGFLGLSASGGDGGNVDAFADGALPGTGGSGSGGGSNQPNVWISAPNLSFTGQGFIEVVANGGAGGELLTPRVPSPAPAPAVFGPGGNGGVVVLEATAAGGAITLLGGEGGSVLSAVGSKDPYSGQLTLVAGGGGISAADSFVAAESLVLRGNAASGNNLGQVELLGVNDIRAVSGEVRGSNGGLTLHSISDTLRLGLSATNPLIVHDDILVTGGFGTPFQKDLQLAGTVESLTGTIELETNQFRLAGFSTNEKLVAKSGEIRF
ncbi:MAG: hypothetical protein ACKVOO_06000, partial [Burkholderiaceae bacterium]